jgi:hypothetical protein
VAVTTQLEFINNSLLSIGERPFMTATATTAAQQRAYKIFKDCFHSFTHECGWSFLRSVSPPTSWVGNRALVPQYRSVEHVFLSQRKLVAAFEDEILSYDATTEGTVNLYFLKDNTHIDFYALPSTSDKALIKIVYTSYLTLPTYSAVATIPLTEDFISLMEQLMSAKLCLQMLGDLDSHNIFLREYKERLAKSVQKDQRINRQRPNMFRGGR